MFRGRSGSILSVPALATLVLGGTLTFTLFAGLRWLEFQQEDLAIQRSADLHTAAIRRGVGEAFDVLRGLQQPYEAGAGGPALWRALNRSSLERHPYFLCFALLRPALPDYLEPPGCEHAYGGAAALADKAGLLVRQAAGLRLDFLPAAADTARLLLATPLQRQAPGTAASGPAHALAILDAAKLIASSRDGAGLAAGGYDYALRAAQDGGGAPHLLAQGGSLAAPGQASAWLPPWLASAHAVRAERRFELAGAAWDLELKAQLAPFFLQSAPSYFALLGGALLTLLLTLWVQAQAVRSQRLLAQAQDRIGELLRSNQALHMRERAIEASANAILLINVSDAGRPVVYANPAFERLTGYAPEEIQGKSLWLLNDPDDGQAGVEAILAAYREFRETSTELRCVRKDGRRFWAEVHVAPVWDEDGGAVYFVLAAYDITANKAYEAELEYQANFDTLTGLANRHRLRTRLQLAMSMAARKQHSVWVVSLDLDRFKMVNDSLGHKAGDLVLKAIARRLQATLRESDTLARLGGDEFVLVLPLEMERSPGVAVLQRLLDAISPPLRIGQHELFPTCSMGVAIFPSNGNDPDALVECADIAMYRAKEAGRNNFQFFNPAMNEHVMERLRLEAFMRTAIERDEFELHYQPQVCLGSGQVAGVEALLRWHHPQLGRVSPERFISLAEETGLIVPIGAWVIRTACRQCRKWENEGLGKLRMAVNLSARQFGEPGLVAAIAAELRQSGLAPQQLELELTESMVMADVGRAVGTMRELTALGVKLAIDDFGTGYSSLSYLKQFKIDVLKIDRSFVSDVVTNAGDAAVVRAVTTMAHSMHIEVVAEGVETPEQLDFLRKHGCDRMQGHFFSPALPAEKMTLLLHEKKRLEQASLTACAR